jgi:hypothetical protein
MHSHRHLAAVIAGLLMAASLLAAGPPALAAVAHPAAPTAGAVPVAGTGTATARSVQVQSGTLSPQALAAAKPTAPAGRLPQARRLNPAARTPESPWQGSRRA